jgi:hypothetical protein
VLKDLTHLGEEGELIRDIASSDAPAKLQNSKNNVVGYM